MPLPPLPASNTRRYFLLWTVGATSHHTQIRVADTVDNANAVLAFQNDFGILIPDLGTNVVLDGLEVAEKGSDIRNPVPGWTVLTGTGPIAINGQGLARSFSLRGRSLTGRKTKMLLWGFHIGAQADFELALANQTTTQQAFQAQVQARTDMFLAIDGTKPDWRTNYLEDYNDHWEHELRP